MTKNITLTADAILIEEARERARQDRTSLNQAFRQWLRQYVDRGESARRHEQLMDELSYAVAEPPYDRDEMNERR